MAGPTDGGLFSQYFDPDANGGQGSYTTVGRFVEPWHFEGSSALYDANGKVMKVGGRAPDPVSAAARVIDLISSPTWRSVTPMTYKRKFHTATLLPDGQVLVTGGTQCGDRNNIECPEGAALKPELWNPVSESWSEMSPNPSGIPRVYHSVALLMPDARVLVGGGGLPAAGGELVGGHLCQKLTAPSDPICRTYGHKDVEFFSPPYLFDDSGNAAVRPVINAAPTGVVYGQQFPVTFGNSASIQRVTWLRLPSVSHGIDWDQRINVLNFSASGNQLTVTAPSDARLCPPGHYMLFIMRQGDSGRMVPSEAKIVRISNSAPPPNPGALQFTSSNYSAQENAGFATIQVTRTGGSDGAVSVNYATSNGSAIGGQDYAPASGTLTFANGETSKSFTISITDDTLDEPNETINLTLSGPTGGAILGSPSTAVQTVIDNDLNHGALQFTGNYTAQENVGLAAIQVTRTGGSDGAVSVNYATSNGTATGGQDYTPASGTLTFANGETSKSFTISLTDDTSDEPNETINLTLSAPTGGATLGSPSTAVLTVIDNDEPTPVGGEFVWVDDTTPAGAVLGGTRAGTGWRRQAGRSHIAEPASTNQTWLMEYTSTTSIMRRRR